MISKYYIPTLALQLYLYYKCTILYYIEYRLSWSTRIGIGPNILLTNIMLLSGFLKPVFRNFEKRVIFLIYGRACSVILNSKYR